MRGPSLFSVRDGAVVYSVSEITDALRSLVESEYSDIRIEGELTNFKRYRSGHCYFSLSDGDAQLRCVMFRHYTQYVPFEPKDGMLVRVMGDMSVYERRGDLQLKVRSMRMAGEGALQKAFLALKRKLREEGLFDEERKRALPRFPRLVGVVTSGDGAALHDICTVLQRRFPLVGCIVCSVTVQGMGAAGEIAQAIDAFNALSDDDPQRPDVLIVGRGGGSTEDLWAFNEEPVARALARSGIPTISAVGHETDTSISDFVADVRAATPSMAAEIAVPDGAELESFLQALAARARDCVASGLERHRNDVDRLTRSYGFRRPEHEIRTYRQRLQNQIENLEKGASYRVQQLGHQVDGLQKHLALLDPELPLARGYARVERNGEGIRRAAQLQHNDLITLYFEDGHRDAEIRNES